jgi:competence protein ComEC
MVSIVLFGLIRFQSFNTALGQNRIVIYNIHRKNAIDLIAGRKAFYMGDSGLSDQLSLSRSFHRIQQVSNSRTTTGGNKYLQFRKTRILLLDTPVSFKSNDHKPLVDLLILSGNPKIYMKKLCAALDIKQVIINSSVPGWKGRLWKSDCDSLHINCHDIASEGAFVMTPR